MFVSMTLLGGICRAKEIREKGAFYADREETEEKIRKRGGKDKKEKKETLRGSIKETKKKVTKIRMRPTMRLGELRVEKKGTY